MYRTQEYKKSGLLSDIALIEEEIAFFVQNGSPHTGYKAGKTSQHLGRGS